MPRPADTLRSVRNIDDLIVYLENELDWPLQGYSPEELTFTYEPAELGLKDKDATEIRHIYQLRPLEHGQPWGIFFVEFEQKKLPVVVLRRILSHLVVKNRVSANSAERARWQPEDLLFISTFGGEPSSEREIAFAHFHQEAGDLPTLRVLGWDGADTALKLEHVAAILKERLHWPDDPADHDAWRAQWRTPFRHRIGHIIRTADKLAEELAKLARSICTRAITMLAAESEQGPLRQLHKAFQTALIHDLKEEEFADTYAQTITYGLLTAAISRTDMSEGRHGTVLRTENVTDMVPITNPFLREMLQTFLKAGGRKGGIDFDELGIQDVVELLRGDETDLPAILRDFGNRTRGEDPVIHFYEHFLAAYNKKLKVKRGAFYTPQPVVSYIVRSVHELLQTEFGLEEGLASTITWGKMAQRHPDLKIPQGTDSASPFVVVLDPATGTATFLVEVIDVIYKTMTAKWKQAGRRDSEIQQLWNDYVPRHLLPRLYGYELMMAPYAIAHMKIGLKLFETGYRFGSDERVRIYLTNALEPAQDIQPSLPTFFPALAHEAQAVNSVKRSQKFTAIVGNPPYAGHSSNNGAWINELMQDYYFIQGIPLGEKNPKWLQDDYVKFIRLGQMILTESTIGILGFITNHGYLDNPTFRGLRHSLLVTFNKLCLFDIHGNSKKKEERPGGGRDENVFDIQQGVAICLLVRNLNKPKLTQISHVDIWGSREEKYALLSDINSVKYRQFTPALPFYLLVPQNESMREEYQKYMSLTEVMPTSNVGFVTSRDEFVIAFDRQDLLKRFSEFYDQQIPDKTILNRYAVGKLEVSAARIRFRKRIEWQSIIVNCQYRPFDKRSICYADELLERPRYNMMRHLLEIKNIALISARSNKSSSMNHFFCTRLITETKCGESSTQSCIFPLYLAPDLGSMFHNENNHVNLSQNFFKSLSTSLGLTYDHQSRQVQGSSAETSFFYIYAIFHSPTYRTRYAEFLKIDFPRIPLTSSLHLFHTLSTLGGELVALHLVEAPLLTGIVASYELTARAWRYAYGQQPPLQLTFTGSDQPSVEKVAWTNNTVWLDKAQSVGFHGVPEAVWNFHIGGYQVCEKWLKDRKGRTLSADDLAHYHRIVVALHETIRLMGEIDEVINAHGGWPIQ